MSQSMASAYKSTQLGGYVANSDGLPGLSSTQNKHPNSPPKKNIL